MDAYLKMMDELPLFIKIILAIFINLLWTIYRIIVDYKADSVLRIVLDIILGTLLCPVAMILDILFIIKDGKPLLLSEFIK